MTYTAIELKCLNTFCLKNSNFNKLNPSKTSEKYIKSHYNELTEVLTYLYNISNETKDIKELLYMLKMNINERPKCENPNCKNKKRFISFNKGYSIYCSNRCNMHSTNTYNKFKTTIQNKHPHINWNEINETADNKLIYYYVKTRKNGSQYIDGNKISYTSSWCIKHPDIMNYIKHRFSDTERIDEVIYRIYWRQDTPKTCETCGNKVKFINFKHGYQKFCSHRCKTLNPKVYEKFKSTIEKNKILYPDRNKCILEKRKNTLHKNQLERLGYIKNTVGICTYASKPEMHVYNLLVDIYGVHDVVLHYIDLRYARPWDSYLWECDLYVKSLDLFIECQYFLSHGGHPYNKYNTDDKHTLKILKHKSRQYKINNNSADKNFYDNFINVWTKVDTLKRNVAKKNNLNYIELFEKIKTKDELLNIINNYFKNLKCLS